MAHLSFPLMLLVFAACELQAAEAQPITIELRTTAGETRIEVAGLSAKTLEALADEQARKGAIHVYVVEGDKAAAQGILGTTGVTKEVLWFRPRFPLAAGMRFHAVFDPGMLPGTSGPKQIKEIKIPEKPATAHATELTDIFPSSDRLPENLLKFYLHFSAPMSRGEVYKRVRLLDADGKRIDSAFLELDEELWDPLGKRITLLIQPGRIKQGLRRARIPGQCSKMGSRIHSKSIASGWMHRARN